MAKPNLTEADFAHAAARLGCEVAVIKAFCLVESPRGAFENDGAPTVLFERHKFHQFTNGRFDKIAPDLSNPTAGGYGLYSAQHGRLDRAAKLDRSAALRATSWGQFQLMGFNAGRCGFPDVQSFVNAMYRSAAAQLAAFVSFIESDKELHQALIAKDWPSAAYLYNGAGYRRNEYDKKMAAAYKGFARVQ